MPDWSRKKSMVSQRCLVESQSTHLKAILLRTNARMEEALSSAELLSRQEKQETNKLYVTKLIKIVHFFSKK